MTYTSKDDEIGELARAFQGMLDSIREDESDQ
ncbi:MAG: HAMP domain-containing protein [Promethearchaeota archaeon]